MQETLAHMPDKGLLELKTDGRQEAQGITMELWTTAEQLCSPLPSHT